MALLTSYATTNQDSDLKLRDAAARTSIAMGFQVAAACSPTLGVLYLKNVGTTGLGQFVAKIHDASRSVLATSREVEAGVGGGNYIQSAVYTKVPFRFDSPPSLSPSTQYHLVLEGDFAIDASNHASWGSDASSPGYTNGQASVYDGASWSNVSPAVDLCFELWDCTLIDIPIVTGVYGIDTYLDQAFPDAIWMTQPGMTLGKASGGKGAATMCRPLLGFNLPDGGIAAGATINSAYLWWHLSTNLGSMAAELFYIFRCTRDFATEWAHDPATGHYCSWNERCAPHNWLWTTAGGDWDAAMYTNGTFVAAIGGVIQRRWQSFNLETLGLVQDAVDNRNLRLNLLAKHFNEGLAQTGGDIPAYDTGLVTGMRPFIQVDYDNPAVAGRPQPYMVSRSDRPIHQMGV